MSNFHLGIQCVRRIWNMSNFHLGIQCVRHLTQSADKRRVVVTGVGLVTCLGVGVETVWNRLLRGQSGISKIREKGYEQVPSQVAGFVPCGSGSDEFDRERIVPKSQGRGMSLTSAYALAAAEEALSCAGWKPKEESQQERTGVCIGSGLMSLDAVADCGEQFRSGRYRKVSPWFLPEVLINMPAGFVSLRYGLKGPNHTVSTACATGLHSIGDASRFIERGDADVMVAGGAETCTGPLTMAAFSRIRALSTNYNDRPQEASRPFDAERDGFVLSEGAGVVVLEELTHAKNRGATILGEVLGYGLAGDAYHITAPSASGDGARRCMIAAMRDAGVEAKDVGLVNAHATSTPVGDAVESRAIHEVLGKEVLITSTKGALGHLQGAAGSVEAVLTIMSCQTGVIPPTLNLSNPDPDYGLNFVMGSMQYWAAPENGQRIALTNSFGFGGTNACLCVAKFEA